MDFPSFIVGYLSGIAALYAYFAFWRTKSWGRKRRSRFGDDRNHVR